MDTIPQLFFDRLASSADKTAVLVFERETWNERTWQQFADDVVRIAAQLRADGVQAGDRVASYSENRYEWLVIDFAIQLVPAIHVPIHAPLTGVQAKYQIEHSSSRAVIVSTPELGQRIESSYEELPDTVVWYSLDPIPGDSWKPLFDPDFSCNLDEAHATARESAATVSTDDLATILYTSGTTGEPKGVMLSQRNLFTNAKSAAEVFDIDPDGLRLCMLPLSHIFARVCDLYMWVVHGTRMALARSPESVLEDCATLHPTWLNAVPYFFDKCLSYLQAIGRENEPNALRQLFGGQIEYCCSGGAALPVHIFDYYAEQGLPILQGYGLTETSPVVSVSRIDGTRREASGQPIADVEVCLGDDGEILTRGPNLMMGYYRDQAATDAAIRDGWFYTGDYGRLDEDGFIYITGRKKEIIVTAGGKNIAPVLLESLLTQDPLIEQAVVIGDGRKYLTALLVPNPASMQTLLDELGESIKLSATALTHPKVQGRFQQIIARQLQDVSRYEQVQRFVLLDRAFSIEQEEMTPKLSLRRGMIEEHFQEQIEAMYAASRDESSS